MFPGEPVWRALGLADQDWRAAAVGCAVAQLAVSIASPGVEVAVGSDGRRMAAAQVDLFPGEPVGRARGLADQGRCVPASDSFPPQLAAVIPSPCVEVAVRADACGMAAAEAGLAEADAARRGRGQG